MYGGASFPKRGGQEYFGQTPALQTVAREIGALGKQALDANL